MWQARFISAAPKEAEELWQAVENRLREALAALDAGALPNDPHQSRAIRDCMAMHLIRSRGIEWVAKKSTAGAISKVRSELLTDPKQRKWLEIKYLERHGIHAAGREALELIADELLEEARPALDDPKLFWDSVRTHFQTTVAIFATLSLEISTPKPGAGEFLIGDSPTVPLKTGSLIGGPWGGVPLDEATTVIMPLGSQHMASLSKQQAQHELEAEAVAYLNRVQVLNAFKEVCFRPGSGLETMVAGLLHGRPAKPFG
jgi:hypothetical protein